MAYFETIYVTIIHIEELLFWINKDARARDFTTISRRPSTDGRARSKRLQLPTGLQARNQLSIAINATMIMATRTMRSGDLWV